MYVTYHDYHPVRKATEAMRCTWKVRIRSQMLQGGAAWLSELCVAQGQHPERSVPPLGTAAACLALWCAGQGQQHSPARLGTINNQQMSIHQSGLPQEFVAGEEEPAFYSAPAPHCHQPLKHQQFVWVSLLGKINISRVLISITATKDNKVPRSGYKTEALIMISFQS